MDALTKLIVLSQLFLRAIVAIDLTCDSVNPLIQSDATCICTNAPGTGIDWYLDDMFHSSCVLSTICVPQYSGYSYSINMTENVYKMTMNSYNYSDCTKITCKDPSDGSIMQSKVPPSIVFDTTLPTSMSEPGSNNTNGIISVTTGCISGFSDLKYDWFIIVEGLEEIYSVDESSKIDTNDTSLCTKCNTNENGKRTIGFQHKETSGSGTKAVLFKVLLHHTSTNLQLNITSSFYYTVKVTSEDSDDSEDSELSIGAIIGIVFVLVIAVILTCNDLCFYRHKKVNINDVNDGAMEFNRKYFVHLHLELKLLLRLMFMYNKASTLIRKQRYHSKFTQASEYLRHHMKLPTPGFILDVDEKNGEGILVDLVEKTIYYQDPIAEYEI
ncbi:uncharacterized protein LOC132758869 [Ruditapes philippinarum]|uniref:uncharacterized protein LOC132758869 n=1 Tax=Ruditapes philippinarum TaxID=129788 RepID=UPI00295B31A2|nr:uncharacterized protein LOC132758869 [Ruditapes philippinarum]